MNNGTIIVQIGSKQQMFRDRETYPCSWCDYIENLVMMDASELSKDGGVGRIRFNDRSNNMLVQLSVSEGNSRMSDEGKAIILIRDESNSVRSNSYYGVDSFVDFVSESEVFSFSSIDEHVQSLKNFYSAWKIKKGDIGAVVVIVDNYEVFRKVISDDFFNKCYVLCSE